MVAVKANQAEAFLKSPDKNLKAFLFFGNDEGLISERSQQLGQTLAARETPEGEVLRLDDSDLENNPDRLTIELGTVPMFGGRKIVRTTTGRRINTTLLKPLLEADTLEGLLIVEAGALKADDALRKAFEKAPHAAAIGCYEDTGRDIDGVIRSVLVANGLSISREAQEILLSRLGADRVMSRSEIEKLALYAAGKKEIEAADVEAIVGDASALTIDRVVYAAALGNAERTTEEFARALAAGENPQGLILAAERHLHRLHRVRAALDKGRTFDDAIRALRPQIHFKQKDAFAAQCRLWTLDKLARALIRTGLAAKAARLAGPLEATHAERILLALATMARPANAPARTH